jgi:2-(1,2-epoxy-1,2-dihydrophenyl)acetyl-CoA isomerase
MGGGLGLTLACDLVIAAADATFVPAYTRLGTSPDGGATWSITRLIGQRHALERIMPGEQMDAAEAVVSRTTGRVQVEGSSGPRQVAPENGAPFLGNAGERRAQL